MPKLLKIAKKVFTRNISSKSYIIITIIGPFLIVGMFLLQSLTLGSSATDTKSTENILKDRTIKITGINEEILNPLNDIAKYTKTIFIHTVQDEESLRDEIISGEIDAYLIFPKIKTKKDLIEKFNYKYVSNRKNIVITMMLERLIGETIVSKRLEDTGLSVREARELTKHPQIKVIKLTGEGKESEQNLFALIFTIIGFALLLYMTLIFYGREAGKSIVIEKTSKTVEILLSSVNAVDLLSGKILGLGLAGILQYAIWFGMAQLFMEIILPAFGLNTNLIQIEPIHFVYLIIFFILAFFLYSSAYSTFGAVAKDEHNFNQISYPLIFLLVIALMSINSLFSYPDSTFIKVLSYIPFTSPIVMFGRILVQTPPLIEIIICIVILIASILLVVIISAKIFRTGILMSGKKAKLSEIFKWLSYK